MDFHYQYELVISSREALLAYCNTIYEKDFLTENSTFGRGSIRNTLVHIGNTYEFWIGRHALNKEVAFTPSVLIPNTLAVKNFFLNIDGLVEEFINYFSQQPLKEIELKVGDKVIKASPLKLFTHVITHEFHHKGQILSLSRHLGYTPIDTDVIR